MPIILSGVSPVFYTFRTATRSLVIPRVLHNPLYVVAGTNVYNVYEENGINDVPSTALMRTLIHQVQALYH